MNWVIKIDGQMFGVASWWRGRFGTEEEAKRWAQSLRLTYPKSKIEVVSE